MILVMAYALLLSACLAAGAAALEPLCRALRLPTRWGWVLGLGLGVGATGAVMWLPRPADSVAEVLPSPAAMFVQVESTAAMTTPTAPAIWQQAGITVGVVWASASLVLLALLAMAAWRLSRERRAAGHSVVQGHSVLLTDGVGPAVAGVVSPVALIPRWVLELDEPSQRLLLAHEMEHVRARDSAVLAFGALSAALVPWNPLAWWMLRRLRLAVEVDCDQRVLARGTAVRRYAELLLMTARMPSSHPRLLAASLGEGDSDLERRILAMTEGTQRLRRPVLARVVLPATLAAGLTLIACETPRPEPIGPALSRDPDGQVADSADSRVVTGEVESPVLHEVESPSRRQSAACETKMINGEKWIRADCFVRAGVEPHDDFDAEPKKPLTATAGLRTPDPSIKRLAFTVDRVEPKAKDPSRIRDSALSVRRPEIEVVPSRSTLRSEATAPAFVRGAPRWMDRVTGDTATGRAVVPTPLETKVSSLPLEVVVIASDGRELARQRTQRGMKSALLERIRPEDISAIEVVKSAACASATAVLPRNGRWGGCNRIVITLKRGASLPSPVNR